MKALTPLKKHSFKVFLAPTLKLFEVATELFSPFLVRYIIEPPSSSLAWLSLASFSRCSPNTFAQGSLAITPMTLGERFSIKSALLAISN